MAKTKLRNIDPIEKATIIDAVTAAAEKQFLAEVSQKGEKFESLNELLQARKVQVGELVYDTALTPAEKRMLTTHSAWFKHVDAITFIAWDGVRKHKLTLPMAHTRPLPTYLISDHWNDSPDENKPVYFDALSAVSIAVKELDDIQERYMETARQVRHEISTVLAGRVNAQQAMERWPGIEKVYPDIKTLRVEAAQQLAVITTTLDQTFATKA